MYCEKCGTKNEPGSKFCEKCGHKFEVAIIFLTILLNNPVKKVRDNLDTYYNKYQDNYTKELVNIGEILKDNKNNLEVLNDIKKTVNEEINNWVKNFNTSYKDKESLVASYDKVNGAIYSIYTYYDGIDYMLNKKTYDELSTNLKNLYSSKLNYIYGNKEDDDYTKYVYYIKVIENDSYYKSAQEYITNYVKDELASFKEKIDKDLTFAEDTSSEEKLTKYLESLEYIKKNTISNNIDLSTTKDYQDLLAKYENAIFRLLSCFRTLK